METYFILLLLSPLLGALLIRFLAKLSNRTQDNFSGVVAIVSLLVSFYIVIVLLAKQVDGEFILYEWLNVKQAVIVIGVKANQLCRGMLFVVYLVALMVVIFSMVYMRGDDSLSRYYSALCFFVFSMTGITLANNLFMMFIFWELVGISSYILIGFWFKKTEASDASKKAILTNKLGDIGFLAGLLLLWSATGTFNLEKLQNFDFSGLNMTLITVAVLCLFCGAVGKSAQLPMHVWLPDAMEGPTPVSALIHAATMVAAGVYMLARISFLIELSEVAGLVIAWIGGVTMLMAALIATQQNDIKRILAYSTLSQLGYMVMAVGIGASHSAMFHLYTHAFFKALLFLCAGAIIYSLHHKQNIWQMGGLKTRMIAVFFLFSIGTLALIGFPFLSGFYSKGMILEKAYYVSMPLYVMGIFTAFLTAFYMTRLLVVVFLGSALNPDAANCKTSPMLMLVPMQILAFFSVFSASKIFAEKLHLSPVLPEAHEGGFILLIIELSAIAGGVFLGFFIYSNRKEEVINIKFLKNKFYFDEVYDWFVKNIIGSIAVIFSALEKIFIDALVQHLFFTEGSKFIGRKTRLFQSGKLHNYIILFTLGLIIYLFIAIF